MTFKYEDTASKTLAPATRKAIAERIKSDVDAWSVKEYTGEHRSHLGASLIGLPCDRRIWMAFRWLKFEMFDGRMLRLFQTGHREEERFIEALRGIGCTVWEVDPETNKQFRIYGVKGHYGGSTDSVGILPFFPDLPLLMEFKTHNDKSFVHLVNKGVVLAKPQHYAQMCAYGKHYKFKYALYCAKNKNDDDIHYEVVELNWDTGNDLEAKAEEIIRSPTPPRKLSDNPSYYDCRYCPFNGICHHNKPVEKNCRSCRMCEPVDNAEWYCHRWKAIVPAEHLNQGCDSHTPII